LALRPSRLAGKFLRLEVERRGADREMVYTAMQQRIGVGRLYTPAAGDALGGGEIWLLTAAGHRWRPRRAAWIIGYDYAARNGSPTAYRAEIIDLHLSSCSGLRYHARLRLRRAAGTAAPCRRGASEEGSFACTTILHICCVQFPDSKKTH
jgi:hypothetical protein